MSEAPISVFISYSHKDEEFLGDLKAHFALLVREKEIVAWHDRKILGGNDWADEIDENLESAHLILLLVSSSFMDSEYCYAREMTRAMERHQEGSAHVLPIFLRACDFGTAPFGKLQGLPRDARPVTMWPDRDAAYLHIVKELRSVVAQLKKQRESPQPVEIATSGRIFTVPYPRNPFFTGREGALRNLAAQLKAGGKAALGQVESAKLPQLNRAAISGLGGIGKTQTAVEYAYRHRDEYQAVFFVRSASESELITGFAAMAGVLKLPQAKDQDQTAAAQASRRWLAANDGWLLILDNADTPSLLENFLPTDCRGHVIVTSRDSVFAPLHILAPELLAPPPTAEALDFFLLRTQRGAIDSQERQAAAELAEELGCLPLALEQAGAYLVATRANFATYLASYRQRGLELLSRGRPEIAGHPDPVATTWSLNFEEVEKDSPASADILRAAAFLAPDEIPEELFVEGRDALSPRISAALQTGDPLAFSELIAPLLRYSLVNFDATRRVIGIHRLVQEVLKAGVGEERIAQIEKVIKALRSSFPEPEFETWPVYERLLPHLLVTAKLAEESLDLAWLLNAGSVYLAEVARYSESEPLVRRSLRIREALLGEEHPDVATSLNSLGQLFWHQGRYADSEPLLTRALAIREEKLPPEHPDLALSLNNLSVILLERGRLTESEPHFTRSLEIRERVLGSKHPDVAQSLNNLANLYRKQGRFAEAEPIVRRTLAISEMTKGADHPDVARSLCLLAGLYADQRRPAQAEPVVIRALSIYEKILGLDHPDVATALGNLANLLQDQGRLADAERLHWRSLAIREKVLGFEHPDLATGLSQLGNLYMKQGRLNEAEQLYRRSLAIREKALGAEHPDFANSLSNLARLLQLKGKQPAAEVLYRRAQAILEKVHPEGHSSLVSVLERLSGLLLKSSHVKEGKKLASRAKKMKERLVARERERAAGQ